MHIENQAFDAHFARRVGPSIKTRSGIYFHFDDMDAACVNINDVAHSLSNLCRFNGHVRDFFSVAQHSLECSILSQFISRQNGDDQFVTLAKALGCLLHDAHESLIGDVATPLKVHFGKPYREFDDQVSACVHAAFGISELMIEYEDHIKHVDQQMLFSDALRWGMDGVSTNPETGEETMIERSWVPKTFTPHFANAEPLLPKAAKAVFLRRFQEIATQINNLHAQAIN